MSDSFRGGHFLGWQKYKIGRISPERADFSSSLGTTTITLSPIGAKDGVALYAIAIESHRFLIFEIAQPIPGTTAEGVLVYTVDSNVESGKRPIEVYPRTKQYSDQYGNNYLAPYFVGDERGILVPKDKGKTLRVTFYVTSKIGDSYVVRITIGPVPQGLIDQNE
jgi:hypothetical protein